MNKPSLGAVVRRGRVYHNRIFPYRRPASRRFERGLKKFGQHTPCTPGMNTAGKIIDPRIRHAYEDERDERFRLTIERDFRLEIEQDFE